MTSSRVTSSDKTYFCHKRLHFFNSVISGSNFKYKCIFDTDHHQDFRSDSVTNT